MKNFLDIGIPAELTGVLDRLNIVNPTEIQELSIPSALRGDDILASAQTGTGKTFTIEGVQAQSDAASYKDDPTAGLIPRALHHLFEKLCFKGEKWRSLMIVNKS